jgi:hypothetical protein
MNNNDYEKGASDCEQGITAKQNQSGDYYLGYSQSYEAQEKESAKCGEL